MASIGRGLASDGEAAGRTIATSANETIALTLLFTRPAPCRRQSKGHTDTQVPVLLVRLDRGTETPVTMRQRVSGTKTRDATECLGISPGDPSGVGPIVRISSVFPRRDDLAKERIRDRALARKGRSRRSARAARIKCRCGPRTSPGPGHVELPT